jgi:glycosyltransferase involved in cell wall biosynthesis
MSKPRISVLIDTYNHERFIECAIASVLAQDMPLDDVEILVVDDGSTDRTPEIIRRFEPRVRLIHKSNGGQASAFNTGIAEARGEIIAFLDGDDWWAPEKLSRVRQAFDADPSLGIVGHGIVMVHLDGSRLAETLLDGFRFQANTVTGARMLRVRGSLLGTSRMTIRAELLHRIGPVPEGLVVQADEYLSTLASVLAAARILPETLTYYRLHEANGFQISTSDPERLRRKQEVLANLSRALEQELRTRGVFPQTIRMIVERIQAEADQLRLTLDGGWPWETVKTEQKLYEVLHPEAVLLHRIFKIMTLFLVIVLPPRFYYYLRQKCSTNSLYLSARKRWLPIPEMPHIQRDGRASL